jgi:hypothetical protein
VEEPRLSSVRHRPHGRLPLPASHARCSWTITTRLRRSNLKRGDDTGSESRERLALLQAYFEGVSQCVTDVVEGNDHEDDADGRRHDLPPVAIIGEGDTGI